MIVVSSRNDETDVRVVGTQPHSHSLSGFDRLNAPLVRRPRSSPLDGGVILWFDLSCTLTALDCACKLRSREPRSQMHRAHSLRLTLPGIAD